jgi:glycosyltransferase involved in cell wall biosynthesis
MCGSLLEAMSCKIPVLARKIPGNSNIITHLYNGLLFNDGKEFIELAKSIIKSNELTDKLINNAYNGIQERHSKEIERELFMKPIINWIDTCSI